MPALTYTDITLMESHLSELVRFMSETAATNGMEIQSCAEAIDLTSVGIPHGKCIDDKLLNSEFGLSIAAAKDKGQREECGCVKSIDIGQYNTCLHGCTYCYATFSEVSVTKNKRLHNPESPLLVGEFDGDEAVLLSKDPKIQSSLF